jgi:hypothetical protein
MVQRVASYDTVELGHDKYQFILGAWSDPDNIREGFIRELHETITKFGDNLLNKATVVLPIPQLTNENFSEIMKKSWPKYVKELMENPAVNSKVKAPCFLIVIDKSFKNFDPSSDNVAIIWLPYSADSLRKFERICNSISDRVKLHHDLFQYFRSRFDRIPYETRGRLPGNPEEARKAGEFLNFAVEGYTNLISFNADTLADILSDQIGRIDSSNTEKGIIAKIIKYAKNCRNFVVRIWNDKVWSKVIAGVMLAFILAALVSYGFWFNVPPSGH